MKYIITKEEQSLSGSTCHFEFKKGKFQDKHWLDTSLFIHMEIFDELELYKLLSFALEKFNYYGPTEIEKEQWSEISEFAKSKTQWNAFCEELASWTEACFFEDQCFTICGI